MMKKIILFMCFGWISCAGSKQQLEREINVDSFVNKIKTNGRLDFYEAKRTLFKLGAPPCYNAVECRKIETHIRYPAFSFDENQSDDLVSMEALMVQLPATEKEASLSPHDETIANAYGHIFAYYMSHDCKTASDSCPDVVKVRELDLQGNELKRLEEGN